MDDEYKTPDKTAGELFGADVVVLAVLLHLAEHAKELNDGPFRSGWESAIEEAGAHIDGMAKDGNYTMQTLMEQVVGLMNGSHILTETPRRPIEVVSELDDAITSIIRDVAELPDRTSPSDDPETMLVRESELRDILWRHLDGWGRTPMTVERSAIDRLADKIDDTLSLGFRRITLQGAELDWVRDALRKNVRSHGERGMTNE